MGDAEHLEWNCLDVLKTQSAQKRHDIHQAMTHDAAVLCLNVKGDINVGNMIRTACLMGCRAFYLAGRKKYDRRYSVGANHYIDVQYLPDVYDVVIDTHHDLECQCGECKVVNCEALVGFLKDYGGTPCFVEQGGTSVVDPVWKRVAERPVFIYGNEQRGIPDHVIRYVKKEIPAMMVLSIPQFGILRSHNVATSCSIVLWEFVRAHQSQNLMSDV